MPLVDRLTPVLLSQVQNFIFTPLERCFQVVELQRGSVESRYGSHVIIFSMIKACDLYGYNRMIEKYCLPDNFHSLFEKPATGFRSPGIILL